jgi:hypothetical protein
MIEFITDLWSFLRVRKKNVVIAYYCYLKSIRWLSRSVATISFSKFYLYPVLKEQFK